MAPTGVAAINIDETTMHTALNIPINLFGKIITPMRQDEIKLNDKII